MRASDLIRQLQRAVAAHGDLEVFSTADWGIVGELTVEPPYEVPAGTQTAPAQPFIMLWEGGEAAADSIDAGWLRAAS